MNKNIKLIYSTVKTTRTGKKKKEKKKRKEKRNIVNLPWQLLRYFDHHVSGQDVSKHTGNTGLKHVTTSKP